MPFAFIIHDGDDGNHSRHRSVLGVRENPADCICQSQALNSAVLVLVFGVGVENVLKR